MYLDELTTGPIMKGNVTFDLLSEIRPAIGISTFWLITANGERFSRVFNTGVWLEHNLTAAIDTIEHFTLEDIQYASNLTHPVTVFYFFGIREYHEYHISDAYMVRQDHPCN
jgi:hypothetical protein